MWSDTPVSSLPPVVQSRRPVTPASAGPPRCMSPAITAHRPGLATRRPRTANSPTKHCSAALPAGYCRSGIVIGAGSGGEPEADLFAEDSVAECGDALGRSDAGAPLRQHASGQGVRGRGRREVGGRAASADGRMAVGGFRGARRRRRRGRQPRGARPSDLLVLMLGSRAKDAGSGPSTTPTRSPCS